MEEFNNILEEREKHVHYSIDKNVVLIFGEEGSGKSILTKFIAGNDDSVSENPEDSVEYFTNKEDRTKKSSEKNWQTYVPYLVEDAKTNTTFYDCPEYPITGSEANEISAIHYLKKVIDSSGSVKLVFTITHDSLENEQIFLRRLIEPAIKFVKNIEKFKDSIALVVTKVKDTKSSDVKVSEEAIVHSIGEFLTNITDKLESHVSNNSLIYSNEIYSDGIPFIKTLLYSIRGYFSKISIFKMPAYSDSDMLTNMRSLKRNRKYLKKIINENIVFSSHNTTDFGYSISAESILYMKSLANEINEKVAGEIREIGQQLERHYRNQEDQTHDIKALYYELHLSYETLSSAQRNIFKYSEPHNLVRQITKNINLRAGYILESISDRIVVCTETMKVLRNVFASEAIAYYPSKWAHALTDVVKYLDNSQRWYNFLKNLRIIMSKYDVQRNLTQYADAISTLQLRIANSDDNRQSIIESLKVLLYRISKDDFERELIKIKDIRLDNHKLKHLTSILNLTLKNNTTSSREGDKLIIKSRYVKLSDIVNVEFAHVKSVEIFALNKVFIDTSLNITTDLSQIFIISPEWEIIGHPEIKLNNKFKSDDNVKSLVGIGQHFHGHGHLSIFTKNSKAKNERWFGKNIKVIGEEESLVKNDNDFIDVEYVKIVKLSNNFDVYVNDLVGGIQFSNTEDKKIMKIQNVQPEVDARVHSAINDFKSYARECLAIDLQESFLRNFVELLENHKYVKNSYSTLGFVNELYDIEDQFFTLGKEISFIPFYQSFLHRLNEYAENNNDKLTNDDKKVLSYLNAVTMSKIYCNNDDIPDYFAKDLKESLMTVIDDIKELTRSNNLNDTIFINDCKLNEQKLIEETSSEISNFIELQIKPNKDNLFLKVDELSSKELIKLKMLSSIFETLTDFLNLVGLVGARAASIIKSNNITNESSSLDAAKIYNMYPITNLLTEVHNFDLKIKKQTKNKKELLIQLLRKSRGTLYNTELPLNELDKIDWKIYEAKKNLNTKTNDSISMNELYNIQKEMVQLIQKQNDSLIGQDAQTNLKNDEKVEFVNRILEITSMAQLPFDFYNEIKSNTTKINNVVETLKQAKTEFNQLSQYEKNIYDIITAVCAAINDNVKDTENILQIKPYAALNVNKWQMQRSLENMLDNMQSLTTSASLPKYFNHYVDKLEKSTVNIISMYNRIEIVRNKIQRIVYSANIKYSNEGRKIKLHSETLNTAINKLKLIMRSNLVLKKKESALSFFKQYIYPFSNYFFEKYELPPALQLTDRNSLVSDAARSLDSLRDDHIRENIYLNTKIKLMSYVGNVFFPLIKWKHSIKKDAISKLLEGKEISLTSDVRQSLFDFIMAGALKFNEVRINFKVANEDKAMQSELNKHLQDFNITMIHSGDSYYKCNDHIHVISSESFTITFSLAKNKDGNPLKTNEVYDKLKNHEAILSPFTTWHVKLSNINGEDFNTLAKYKNEAIDLELEAKMNWMADRGNVMHVCNDGLNNYYTSYDSYDTNIYTMNYTNPSERHKRDISKIQSHIRSSHIVRKNLYRKRRGGLLLAPNHQHATNGASSSTKSSIINSIVTIMGTHFVALRYLNPINKISDWFSKDDENVIFKESLALNNNLLIDSKLSVRPMSRTFLEDETFPISDAFGFSSFCNHGNLLLLDLMIRHKNGIKYKQQDFEMTKAYDCEYAQNLAYGEYVPDL